NPRLPATGLSAATGNPLPPPKGSSGQMYSGFQTPPQNQPGGQQPGAQQPGQPQNQQPDPIAVIETNRGRITLRLFRQYAPKTVEAFVDMVNKGFYNGLLWHRVEPGFVIQGGCPNGNGTGLYIDPETNKPR